MMDADEASGSSAPDANRQKRSDESDPSRIADVEALDAVVTYVEQTGDIFKLDIDCFEESFDYLPMNDLVNVGKTCKRLQQMAGHCFQQNYAGYAFYDALGIQSNVEGSSYSPMVHHVDHFVPFVQKMLIAVGGFELFSRTSSKFHRLKEIEVFALNESQVRRVIEISMSKLKVLRIRLCNFFKYFNEIINQCTKLKRLEIEWCTGEFDWIDHKCPTLEYLKLNWYRHDSVDGIPTFLELNPSIRKFATTAELLWKYRNKFISANVKLDDLAIYSDTFLNGEPVCNFLNGLYESGFYKKLELYFKNISNQDQINQLATSFNGLVKLYVKDCSGSYGFSSMKTLEELYVKESKFVADLKVLPNILTNLKRVHFRCASIDDIMPFIRRSVAMWRIRVDDLEPGVHFNEDTGIINLLALNRERDQLPDAQKITIYVEERIYLATKWAMKGNDFGLIRMKRLDSFEWNHDF